MNKLKSIGIIAIILLLLAGGVIATVGMNAIAPVLQQYGQQVQSAQEITKETSDAQYAMNQREEFETLRQDIKAMKQKIKNQRTQMKSFKERNDMDDLSYIEQKQYNRMTTRLLGYKNNYQNYVAEYNKKMNISYQRQYSDELPLDMQEKFWTGDLIP